MINRYRNNLYQVISKLHANVFFFLCFILLKYLSLFIFYIKKSAFYHNFVKIHEKTKILQNYEK